MPRSRSWSIESMTRSVRCSWAPNTPDWRSIASTSVVLPWSTWAMIATLRRSSRTAMRRSRVERGRSLAGKIVGRDAARVHIDHARAAAVRQADDLLEHGDPHVQLDLLGHAKAVVHDRRETVARPGP